MSTEELKTIVRHFYDEFFNQHRLDAADSVVATDLVWNGNQMGLEGLKQWIVELFVAFPGFWLEIEDIIAEGDKVVVRAKWGGRHEGLWGTFPPTGRKYTNTGISIAQFVEGRIAEIWNSEDALGAFQQLGLIPPLGEGEG